MTDLTDDQLKELTFITGVDQNGAIASNTFYTFSVQGLATNKVYISKWYNDANGTPIASTSRAGTPGGTVTYGFDPALPAAADAAYAAGLTLWSDVANISFQQSDYSTASIQFTTTDSVGDTFVPSNGSVTPGIGIVDIHSQMAPNTKGGPAIIGVQPFDQSWNSFDGQNANLMSTVVHEEGHVLGLGHAGPYNGTASGAQLTPYDSSQWSVMSYKTAGYSLTDNSGNNYNASAQTPMMLDILSAQRLYGASTSKTFAGGQTYGFNNNISDASREFYDFSQNANPVVTIYNTGTNNTLDLSGFATASRIDLHQGSFSSASTSGTLTNNIGIAYGTRIDRAIGGAGDDQFVLNDDGDTIDGGLGYNKVLIRGDASNFTVTKTGAASMIVTDKTTGAVDTLTNIQSLRFVPPTPLCFTTGTRIRLRRGGTIRDEPVEHLRVGDVAVTATGRERPVRWIGRRELGEGRDLLPARLWPVRVRAGAFGTDARGEPAPARDLCLSPGHPVLVGADEQGAGGVLVPIMCLINGTSIDRMPTAAVTYWHIELDAHDVLLAEGLPAESYLDLGSRPWFEAASADALHDPDAVETRAKGRCRPTATDGPAVEAERRRLDALFAAALSDHCAWVDAGALARAF